MNKKELLESLSRVYCRLMVSNVHGIGVFAIRDIPKGINPFVDSPNVAFITISPNDLDGQPDGIVKLVKDFCPLQEGKYYLPAKGMGAIDVSYYLNHSKTPNMREEGEGEYFITIRDIKIGEELTVDYDTYNDIPEPTTDPQKGECKRNRSKENKNKYFGKGT